MRPLFLLSLPRSGSTLVQRVLAHHPEIDTASETWLLVPLLAASSRARFPAQGAWGRTAADALVDFSPHLPAGMGSYREAVHDFGMRLYSEAAREGAAYYLDKTPPYALFVPELIDAFPEAKLVALWRNPLAVVASVVETFCDGRWEPNRYSLSLFDALAALAEATESHPDRVWSVRFEDLVSGSLETWRGLMDFLGLDFDPASLSRFNQVRLDGQLGDASGVARYQALSVEPLAKWTRIVHTPVRKAWCRRYLEWIGPHRLSVMGYNDAELRSQLDKAPVGVAGLVGDSLRVAESLARRVWRTRSRWPSPSSTPHGSGPSAAVLSERDKAGAPGTVRPAGALTDSPSSLPGSPS